MRKLVINALLAATLVGSVSSCSTLGGYNVYKSAPFTDVDKIMMLKPGMSVEQVRSTLGIDPYNVYHLSEENSLLLSFSYRLKERRLQVKTLNSDEIARRTTDEASQTEGEVRYSKKNPKVAYVLFKQEKMVSIITTDGNNESERIMIKSNNLSLIQKDNITDYDVIETVEVTGDKSITKRKRRRK